MPTEPDNSGQIIEILRPLDERLTSIEARIGSGGAPGAITRDKLTGTVKPSQYGGYSVDFECRFDKDANEIWKTLADQPRMVDWYAEAEGDVSEGGPPPAAFRQ